MKHVLVTWVGNTDLKAAAGKIDELGPIGSVVCERNFNSVVLLSNYAAAEAEPFRDWLSSKTSAALELIPVSLSNPMDYREVYEAADRCVATSLMEGDVRLTFHLSPGTPAMHAMWLILATTKYPAELIASSRESGVYTPEFPFEIAADYVPRRAAAAKGKAVTAAYQERTPPAFDKIIHACDAMKKIIARAQRVAEFDVPVMILGESGTGKELFAEAIHHASPRASGPYVPVNCGALPRDLVESELFGHRKGAFTGANEDRRGRFVEADGGTLFLDELGELPLAAQVKLLRVLQEGEVRRVGDDKPTAVDVRIVSATNKDLSVEIQEGRFREDLFHRLAIGVLNLPPLRDRPGDLSKLVDFKLNSLKDSLRKGGESQIPTLHSGAQTILRQHNWSGNIRELFNALTRAAIWCESDKISKQEMLDSLLSLQQPQQFSADAIPLGGGFQLKKFLWELEKSLIERAGNQTRRQKEAAELLGISDALLRQKLRKIEDGT